MRPGYAPIPGNIIDLAAGDEAKQNKFVVCYLSLRC
jgi:hypothetical protein